MVLMPILLTILYPLSPALRLYEFVRWLLSQVLSWLEMLEEEDTATLIRIDAFLSIIEQFLHAIIGKLAVERLGLTFRRKPSMGLMPAPRSGKPLSFQQLFDRFERLVMMFQDIDRLVLRRASQIRKDREANAIPSLFTAFAAQAAHPAAEATMLQVFTRGGPRRSERFASSPQTRVRGPPHRFDSENQCPSQPAGFACENETSCPVSTRIPPPVSASPGLSVRVTR